MSQMNNNDRKGNTDQYINSAKCTPVIKDYERRKTCNLICDGCYPMNVGISNGGFNSKQTLENCLATVVVLVTTTLGWLCDTIDDLKAIIEHLNLEDVVLVGFSMVAAKLVYIF
jgi:hypothetical protein